MSSEIPPSSDNATSFDGPASADDPASSDGPASSDDPGTANFSVVSQSEVPVVDPGAVKFAGEVAQQEVLPAQQPGGLRGHRFAYAPGARSAWHIHQGEQALVILEGHGLIQWEGLDAPRSVRPGDWVHVQPGIPHWHGAAPDSEFVHLAITASGGTEWLDHVEADDA